MINKQNNIATEIIDISGTKNEQETLYENKQIKSFLKSADNTFYEEENDYYASK